MEQDVLLQATDLTKYFPVTKGLVLQKIVGWVQAVDHINFTIPRGKTLARVGESGCGKTTTAKLILRLERPTTGQIQLENSDVHTMEGDELKQYHTDVQAVFQDPWSSLSPRMRVRDIISEALVVNQKVQKQEAYDRVDYLLTAVGLRTQQATLYPHEFSGGQRQRLALAAALVGNPKLICLDEPVSALDVSIRAQIMNLLEDLQDEHNLTYLLIAHHLATVRYMCDKVGVMYLGRIVEEAETEELYDNPLHPYTRALFSAALTANPDSQREEIILRGEVPSPINPPSGCRFHVRCPYAMDICSEQIPERKEMAPGHFVNCHLY